MSSNDIEMTTFSETNIKRSRSGSFTGTIQDLPDSQRAGYSKFSYSQSSGNFEVKTITSGGPGRGSHMMGQMEDIARESGANKMLSATSRPGFFKKMGFDYTQQQKQVNALKYSQQELAQHENNRGQQGGGGFAMFKDL